MASEPKVKSQDGADSSEVSHEYDKLVECGVKVIDGLSREPKDFAVVLHSKGFIAKQILQEIVEIPATSIENARKLYSAVLDVVEHYPHRYKELISILQDNPLLYGDLLKVLEEDFSKNDSTAPEQSSCFLTHSLTPLLPTTLGDLQPPPANMVVPSSLGTVINALEKRYTDLTRATYRCLQSRSVSTHDFCGIFTCMNISLREACWNFVEDCVMELKAGSHVSVIWTMLNGIWDFFNFELLEHVVEGFVSEGDPLREKMKAYAAEVEVFGRCTKVSEFFQDWPLRKKKPEKSVMKAVVVKVERSWEDCTLQDVKDMAATLAQKFFLPRYVLIARDVKEGCVSILWYVPPSIARQLEKGVWKVEPGFFQALSFQFISIDDVHVYPLTPMMEYSHYIQGLYDTKQQPLSSSKPITERFLAPFKLAKIENEKLHVYDGPDEFTKRSLRGDKDDIWSRKSPIDVSALGTLPDGSPANLVLIEGAPGVGKTTFSLNYCQMWGRKEILRNISTLILLCLRDYGLKEVTRLRELLAHTKPGAESLEEEMEANKGEGIAIWLDGWDEIAFTLDDHSSIYERLVSGEVLSKATVIVSSRPWATDYIKHHLNKRPSQHIELIASVRDQFEYLLQIEVKNSSSKSSTSLARFLDYLSKTPAIQAAMHTPMATQITLEVYHSSQETGSPLPSTVTDLYTAYTCRLVHKYLDNHPLLGLKSWRSNNFRDLPEPVNKMFISLCQLAYEGLLDGQRLVFPDLPEHLKHLQLETLGLMQAQAPLYASENSSVLSYHYNHLTEQEFLSAYFISQQELTERQRNDICRKCIKEGHFTMVMRFLSGQTGSTFIHHDVMRSMLSYDEDKLTLFHWLFEGGQTAPVSDILGNREIEVKSQYTWTALDYYVTGYVIAHSDCTWDIDASLSSIGDEGMELFIKGLCTSSEGVRKRGHIRCIDLSGNALSSQSLSHVVDIPAHILHPLKEFNLSSNNVDHTAMDHIAMAIPHMPELEVLNLGHNCEISRGGAVAVAISLRNHKVLRELHLAATNIDSEDCEHIAYLLSCSLSLEKLDVGSNSLTSDKIHIVLSGLHQNSSLKHLEFGPYPDNQIALDNMKSLSTYLLEKGKCKLEMLNLSHYNMEPEAVVQLARGLSHNCSVKILDLSDNHVGDEGATALGQTLLQNKSLTVLTLEECRITTTGGAALAASLLKNTSLERLDINDNALGGGEAIETFTNVVHHNKTLKRLDIRHDNTLSQSDVSTLLSAIKHNRTLEQLWLPKKLEVDTDWRVMWWS